jgi:agmatinase
VDADLGLPTFGERDWVSDPAQLAERAPDVAIVGAPFDIATTFRPGARFGPRALRAAAYHPGSYHLDLGVDIFDWLDVVDAGDAHCPHGQTERSHRNIEEKVAAVAGTGAFPVIIGGDHSITWPAATAVARRHGWGRLGLLHFDAHADTADSLEGNLASHGTPMRRLIESGAVPGHRFVQIGLRGYWPPPETLAWMREQRMRSYFMEEITRRGLPVVVDEAVQAAVGGGARGVFLSVDIDVVDPGMAPGTGTPEPGGLTARELLDTVRRLGRDLNILGADLVEVAPHYDQPADITAGLANRVVLELTTGIAERRLVGSQLAGEAAQAE